MNQSHRCTVLNQNLVPSCAQQIILVTVKHCVIERVLLRCMMYTEAHAICTSTTVVSAH